MLKAEFLWREFQQYYNWDKSNVFYVWRNVLRPLDNRKIIPVFHPNALWSFKVWDHWASCYNPVAKSSSTQTNWNV